MTFPVSQTSTSIRLILNKIDFELISRWVSQTGTSMPPTMAMTTSIVCGSGEQFVVVVVVDCCGPGGKFWEAPT